MADLRPIKTCLSVPGVCCDAEARMIHAALDGLSGVEEVSVDVIGRKTYVRHAPDLTPAEILTALQPLALRAALQPDGPPKRRGLALPIAAVTTPAKPASIAAPGTPEPAPEMAPEPAPASEPKQTPASPTDQVTVVPEAPTPEDDRHDHARHAPTEGFPWPLAAAGTLVGVTMLEGWFPGAEWAALGAMALGLPPVARKGLIALRARVLDINFLMALAAIGALIIGEWGEGATVVFLFAVAEWLEARAMDRARAAIAAVMELAPEVAILASGVQVPAASVAVGTRLLIRPGARVPLDGRVVTGASAVDESALTGEAVPVAKAVGDPVSAGTVNQGGALVVEATAAAGDSAVARMARLVAEAQAARSPTERWVDRFSRVYTPAVVALAAGIAVVPPLLGGDLRAWFYQSLVLLVVACPCALVLSTPITMVSALARAARSGVLIKGGVHLEALGRLRALALDKTGTLTEGRFKVVDCVACQGSSEAELHRAIAAVESASSHPLASALLAHSLGPAQANGALPAPTTYQTLDGEGISATVEGRTIHIGNRRMALRLGLDDASAQARHDAWAAAGRTVVYVALDHRLAGQLSLADLPRPHARTAIAALEAAGLSTAILTGDNRGTAAAVAQAVGVQHVHAELLPAGKLEALRELRATYGSVGMVGDGINDGPALAAADVGIAMGARGTAVAMEAADVALMGDDLLRLPWAIRLGRAAVARVKLNVVIALGAKAAVMALSLAGAANLWLAVAADMGTSLAVIALGLGMLRFPEAPQEH